MSELRLALRRLLKRPAAVVASIATLACAIAAAAVTWSTLSAVLLSPLPVKDPEQVVVVSTMATTGPYAGTLHRGVMYPYFPHVRDSGVFEQVAAAWLPPLGLLARVDDGTPEPTQTAFVSHNFFDLLGLGLSSGRGFTGEDDRRGAAAVAVLSHRYWQRAWNSAPGAVGSTFLVNKTVVTIVGVAQPRFRGINLAEAPDVYLPFHVITDVASPMTNYLAEVGHQSSPSASVTLVGRLRPGSTAADATARLGVLGAPQDPRLKEKLAASPLNTEALPLTARASVAQFSGLLAATVGLLLFAGCTTVGLLLLLRTEARRDEFAMCLALGASRGRLVRGIAMEGAVLGLCGAALSLPIAVWLFTLLRAFQLPGGVTLSLLDLSLDRRSLSAAAAAAVAVVVATALIAGVFGFRASLAEAIRSRTGSTRLSSGRNVRAFLVCVQVAVALFLLSGAGLFARSLSSALSLNAGLDPGRLIPVQIALGPYGYSGERATPLLAELRDRLASNPAVASISSTFVSGGMSGAMPIDGTPRTFPTTINFRSIDAHYFGTLGITMLSGRNFATTDNDGSPMVGIVSQSFARLLADGGNPVGKRITMPYRRAGAPAAPQVEVIGVVPDVITNVAVMEPLVLYMPLAQQVPIASREFLIRAAGDENAARGAILTAIRELDPAVTPAPMYTMQERIGRQMGAQQFAGTVMAALGIVAILLALLGAYVLADSMASVRMREMGIRAALGATRRQLGSIVLTQTARLVGIGIIAGVALASLGAKMIRAFLFRVQPLDPTTLLTVAGLILLLTMAVSLRAALRVARVDLAQVLRDD